MKLTSYVFICQSYQPWQPNTQGLLQEDFTPLIPCLGEKQKAWKPWGAPFHPHGGGGGLDLSNPAIYLKSTKITF